MTFRAVQPPRYERDTLKSRYHLLPCACTSLRLLLEVKDGTATPTAMGISHHLRGSDRVKYTVTHLKQSHQLY